MASAAKYSGQNIASIRVVINAAAARPLRLHAVEAAVVGKPRNEETADARRSDRDSRSAGAALQRLQDPVDAESGEAGHSRRGWHMDFVKWGLNPWGQSVLTHVSWTLFWASLFAGVMFFVAHASYMLLSAHRGRPAAKPTGWKPPTRTSPLASSGTRLMARLFHWVMAAAMFVLLFTAFLPVVGVKFAWVTWHWMAGLVLTGSIIFHILHASFWLDFWSIWVGPKDIPEFKAEILRELGQEVPGPKSGKYPLGNRLYHSAIVVAGLAAVATGVLMMSRVRTPLFTRNPYLFS